MWSDAVLLLVSCGQDGVQAQTDPPGRVTALPDVLAKR